MATIVYASDLHGNREAYERLFDLEADGVVLGGDLLPYPLKRGGDLISIQRDFVEGYLKAKVASRPCWWIPGNDDWAEAVAGMDGSVHGRAVPFLDGLSIAGYGCVPLTPFGMKDFDRWDDASWEPRELPRRCLVSTPEGIREAALADVRSRGTIEADLEALAGQSDPSRTVYVVHSPPFATRLDRLAGGIASIGSRALRRFIEKRQPPLTLHGHIHESPGVDRLGRTVSVNPGDSAQKLRALRIDLATMSVAEAAP